MNSFTDRWVNWEGTSLLNTHTREHVILMIKQMFKSKRASRSPKPWCFKTGQKALSKSAKFLHQEQNSNKAVFPCRELSRLFKHFCQLTEQFEGSFIYCVKQRWVVKKHSQGRYRMDPNLDKDFGPPFQVLTMSCICRICPPWHPKLIGWKLSHCCCLTPEQHTLPQHFVQTKQSFHPEPVCHSKHLDEGIFSLSKYSLTIFSL